MISLRDVVTGFGNRDPLAEVWRRSLRGGSAVITGVPPLRYIGDGRPLTDYLISGNTVQDGTPSADAPVDAVGCGVRTGNLFDKNNTTIYNLFPGTENTIRVSSNARSIAIPCVGGETYTVSKKVGERFMVCFTTEPIATQVTYTNLTTNNTAESITVTAPLDAKYLFVYFFNSTADTDTAETLINSIMINTGSTALPYEPYGFKLGISSGGENLAWTGWAQDFVGRIGADTRASIVTDDGRECLKYNVSAGYGHYDTKYIFKTEWKENTRYSISFYGKRPTGMTPVGVMQLIYTDDTCDEIRVQSAGVGNYVQYVVMSAAGKTVKSLCALYSSGSFIIDINTFMVNEGDTAKPYSPYNRTSTPIYLGQVETTRRVKKLVLTGEEAFGYSTLCFTYTFDGKPASVQPSKTVIFSNAYKGVEPMYRDQLRNYECCITRNFNQIAIRDNNYTDVADFKSYLAAQYAAGTPVTVWYVLAEPETAVVNEPLMKIGDYADTVSFAQAGVTIPTVSGANVLDVPTEVKPSEITIKGGIISV